MTTTKPDTIEDVEINNIGPIESLRLAAKPGTITVLAGPNGAGKSQALAAIDKLATGKGRLSKLDGANGRAEASGFGVRVTVSRDGSNRSNGDLVVDTLEDRLNVADLVDPKLKDPVAADVRRIKALVTLAEVEPDAEIFYPLFGSREAFDEVVPLEAYEDRNGDIVSLSAAIKRSIESSARRTEDERDEYKRLASERRAIAEGVDVEAECDVQELQSWLESALSARAQLEARKQIYRDQVEADRQARATLDELTANGRPQIAQLSVIESEQSEQVEKLENSIEELHRRLEDLRNEHGLANQRLANTRKELKTAKETQAKIDEIESLLQDAFAAPPTDEELQEAAATVDQCRSDVQQGEVVRRAKAAIAEAGKLDAEADEKDKLAERYRDAAKGTETILSDLVSKMGGPFLVDEDFRLCVNHPKRGQCRFAELSEGERWKLSLDVAINALSGTAKPGLLSIPQEAWDALDERNRQDIARHISGTDLAIITAESRILYDDNHSAIDGITPEQFQLEGANDNV